MNRRCIHLLILGLACVLLLCAEALALQRFPPPDFEGGHEMPSMTQPPPREGWKSVMDVAALVLGLGVAAWIVLRFRSRKAMVFLTIAAVAYFGFYRAGCVCPIGSIQNVTLALADGEYAVPLVVILFFGLPLLAALFFGRVFCSGVCPLGALQDIVLVKPVRVPRWLEHTLGVAPFIYLGLAVYLAATGAMFVICRFDPFIAFFRLSGRFSMLIYSGIFLGVCLFVGRPYCRFLCPYGAVLNLFSRTSRRRASITPDDCVVCGLCHDACPFGAIDPANTEGEES